MADMIISDGYEMIKAQNEVSKSADQRSLSLLGISSTICLAIAGGIVVMVLDGISVKEIPFLIMALLYMASVMSAIEKTFASYHPSEFYIPGNTPDKWVAGCVPLVGPGLNRSIEESRIRNTQTTIYFNDSEINRIKMLYVDSFAILMRSTTSFLVLAIGTAIVMSVWFPKV
jgi:hypothetical protein